MIEESSTLASFPLTLTKQITQSTEKSLQHTRKEVEDVIDSGFRSEERQSLEESTSPKAAAQPSQDSNPSGEDRGGDTAKSQDGESQDKPRGVVFDDIA